MSKKGVLFVNLGTPDDPTPEAVGRYLREFLMDPLVIDIPAPLRWLFVHALIVPKRKHTSAEAYAQIWTKVGSPLLVHTRDLVERVKPLLKEARVDFAMRYGRPSIRSRIQEAHAAGVSDLLLVPLYPQYSLAATQSTIDEARSCVDALGGGLSLTVVEDFYEHPSFIQPTAAKLDQAVEEHRPDFILFSYHGLPERHVRKTDPSGRHCLSHSECCASISEVNRYCYRAQCFATTRAILGLMRSSVPAHASAFQSRLGRTPWIQPYSDVYYRELPRRGIQKLIVICPSFTADCLETLEEVSIRGRSDFLQAGGKEFHYVPCLNEDEPWVNRLAEFARQMQAGPRSE